MLEVQREHDGARNEGELLLAAAAGTVMAIFGWGSEELKDMIRLSHRYWHGIDPGRVRFAAALVLPRCRDCVILPVADFNAWENSVWATALLIHGKYLRKAISEAERRAVTTQAET